MKDQFPTIILTGGGSGGHITPLMSLARELKAQSPGCRIVYVGFKGDKFNSLNKAESGFDFMVFINAGKFRRYHGESKLSRLLDLKTWLLNVRDFFRFIRSIGAAFRILSKFKPNVVFSKGGFVAVPVGIAAKIKSIPIITHDSDAIPGLANRIVGRWANVHTSGTPGDSHFKDTLFVGVPVSDKFKPVNVKEQGTLKLSIGLSPDDRLLLVGGAGNGSKTLNQLVLQSACELLNSNPTLHIVHIAGLNNAGGLESEYGSILDKAQRKRVKVIGFTKDFYRYSGAADLIISRAGATSLSEFSLQAKACIIIPSPFLAGGHQLENAKALETSDAAVILSNEATADELIGVVASLLGNDKRRRELAVNLSKQAMPSAAEILARLITVCAHGEDINAIEEK